MNQFRHVRERSTPVKLYCTQNISTLYKVHKNQDRSVWYSQQLRTGNELNCFQTQHEIKIVNICANLTMRMESFHVQNIPTLQGQEYL